MLGANKHSENIILCAFFDAFKQSNIIICDYLGLKAYPVCHSNFKMLTRIHSFMPRRKDSIFATFRAKVKQSSLMGLLVSLVPCMVLLTSVFPHIVFATPDPGRDRYVVQNIPD